MARQPLAIARARPHDGEEADGGGGQEIVEGLRRDRPGRAGQGGGGGEPAGQAGQQHRCGGHQSGEQRGVRQPAPLGTTLCGQKGGEDHGRSPIWTTRSAMAASSAL